MAAEPPMSTAEIPSVAMTLRMHVSLLPSSIWALAVLPIARSGSKPIRAITNELSGFPRAPSTEGARLAALRGSAVQLSAQTRDLGAGESAVAADGHGESDLPFPRPPAERLGRDVQDPSRFAGTE